MSKRIAMLLVALAIVLGSFSVMPPKQARAGSMNAPVLLVHGWNKDNKIDCDWSPQWGTIKTFFSNQGYTYTRSVGFYYLDYNCWDYLDVESPHCTGFYDSGANDGTINEDIRHVSCLLAWFIWDRYTQYGTTIAVVAHSMGGILIRQAMFDTPYMSAFPPRLYISDVATAGTPHNPGLIEGASALAFFSGCGSCVQVNQMQASNALMSNLNSRTYRQGFGRNPQGFYGTDWTTMGSDNDWQVLQNCRPLNTEFLGEPNPTEAGVCGLMPGATHFVDYPGPTPSYDHGGYLTDSDTSWNANEKYSDDNGKTWTVTSISNHSIYTMYYAILSSGW